MKDALFLKSDAKVGIIFEYAKLWPLFFEEKSIMGFLYMKICTFVIDKNNTKQYMNMNKSIITVVGKDTVGIIAKVCTYLAENEVNILDISQTIVQEYFNMMMIVDVTRMQKPFEQVVAELAELGNEIGVQIKCQREEIFNKMHRI